MMPLKHLLLFSSLLGSLACTPKLTLQSYFVDHQDRTDFTYMDIPISVLNTENISLSKDQSEAMDSIETLNMILYSLEGGTSETFESEVLTIKKILRAEGYSELMRMGNNLKGKFQISYVEEASEIDELIIFGYSSTSGFMLVRVLGDNIKLSKVVSLAEVIDQLEIENTNVNDFMKFFL